MQEPSLAKPGHRNVKGHPLDALFAIPFLLVRLSRFENQECRMASLVVMTTTPYDASGPYFSRAARPFITWMAVT